MIRARCSRCDYDPRGLIKKNNVGQYIIGIVHAIECPTLIPAKAAALRTAEFKAQKAARS